MGCKGVNVKVFFLGGRMVIGRADEPRQAHIIEQPQTEGRGHLQQRDHVQHIEAREVLHDRTGMTRILLQKTFGCAKNAAAQLHTAMDIAITGLIGKALLAVSAQRRGNDRQRAALATVPTKCGAVLNSTAVSVLASHIADTLIAN